VPQGKPEDEKAVYSLRSGAERQENLGKRFNLNEEVYNRVRRIGVNNDDSGRVSALKEKEMIGKNATRKIWAQNMGAKKGKKGMDMGDGKKPKDVDCHVVG